MDLMLADADVKRLTTILASLGDKRKSIAPAPQGSHYTQLSWEVLPAGWWAQRTIRLLSRGRRKNLNHRERTERIALLDGLKPSAWYRGSLLGEDLYFAAVFNGVAIADAEEFGNALYYYKCDNESWQGIFRLTKRAALGAGARRIHSEGWERRVRNLVWAAEHMKFEGRPRRIV
jgi:hypothetical protein